MIEEDSKEFFKEVRQSLKELAEEHKNLERVLAQSEKRRAESEVRRAEAEARRDEADTKRAEENAIFQATFQKGLEENRQQIKETSNGLKKLEMLVGSRINNQAKAVESYFYHSLQKERTLAGIHFDKVLRNIHSFKGNVEAEFDIIMINSNTIALIEVKQNAHIEDLLHLLNKILPNFRFLFPEYKDYKVYLCIASFSFYEDLEILAKSKGIALLKQVGGVMVSDIEYIMAY